MNSKLKSDTKIDPDTLIQIKNGNTWIRSLISAYYYSNDGLFLGDQSLRNIEQFPTKKNLEGFNFDPNQPGDSARFWVPAQEKINMDKKVRFFKRNLKNL